MPTDPRRYSDTMVIGALALGGVVMSLQQTLLIPLSPRLPDLTGTSEETASWLLTSTLLCGVVAIPVVSRCADLLRKKHVLLATLAVCALGSAVGAVDQSFPSLLAARCLHGVGLALIPVGVAMMREHLSPERLTTGVAILGATMALGAGVGLPLAGVVEAVLGWHAVFLVSGVFTLLVLGAAMLVLPAAPRPAGGSFDFVGATLLSAALTGVMLALATVGSPTVTWVPAALAATGLSLMVIWFLFELRAARPVINVRLLTQPALLLVNTSAGLSGFAMYANMLTTPLFLTPLLTGSRPSDATLVGILMTPAMAVFALMAPITAAIVRRAGPQVALLSGATLMSAAYVARAALHEQTWQVVLNACIVSAGNALAYASLPLLVLRAVPLDEAASASGVNVLMRYLGTTFASAVLAALFSVDDKDSADLAPAGMLAIFAAGATTVVLLLTIPMFRLASLQPLRPRRDWEDDPGHETS